MLFLLLPLSLDDAENESPDEAHHTVVEYSVKILISCVAPFPPLFLPVLGWNHLEVEGLSRQPEGAAHLKDSQ